jgi:hypothetical protein
LGVPADQLKFQKEVEKLLAEWDPWFSFLDTGYSILAVRLRIEESYVYSW